MSNTITIRDATLDDGDFILGAFDSAIEYLPTIGSADQWGPELFSKRRGGSSTQEMSTVVKSSVVHTAHQAAHPDELYGASRGEGDNGEGLLHARVLIAESKVAGEEEQQQTSSRPVAVLAYQDFVPAHLAAHPDFRPSAEAINAREGSYIYVWALVSDFRAGHAARKGAGQALLRETLRIAKKHGVAWMYVDCWTGNERRLVQYYERQGFKLVKDFLFEKPDGSIWPGSLLEIDMAKHDA
ncbi:uncharacterized protein B0I36DRAFT_389215 [Microdochium trichocladiopsis]|uniref:N-acetyltransferase domain-containing protein n=1 Tax=Microdochium trichocladiopsis TaxID=1682393 RepID=A0A9P9BG38_9PEZI|nr:uncharacterized protein B0I36DRAFT_389215 [Microdochium trichocladiopsis]KAH7014264.1 hypothetical protein B0I36DRAFT_389215 [Microdochium trichocladiopsis]